MSWPGGTPSSWRWRQILGRFPTWLAVSVDRDPWSNLNGETAGSTLAPIPCHQSERLGCVASHRIHVKQPSLSTGYKARHYDMKPYRHYMLPGKSNNCYITSNSMGVTTRWMSQQPGAAKSQTQLTFATTQRFRLDTGWCERTNLKGECSFSQFRLNILGGIQVEPGKEYNT